MVRKKNKEHKNYAFIYHCFEISMQQSSIIPPFEKEFRFHPIKKWLSDYAWPDEKLIVEIEGGLFIEHKTVDGKGGGHNRGKAMLKDMNKYNALALERFFLLRYTPHHVETGYALIEIEKWFKMIPSI